MDGIFNIERSMIVDFVDKTTAEMAVESNIVKKTIVGTCDAYTRKHKSNNGVFCVLNSYYPGTITGTGIYFLTNT